METNDFIVKISKYIGAGNENAEGGNKEKKVDFDILERTGVNIAVAKRNSVYGEKQIQTFTVGEKEHREKIVSLLNNPSLYALILEIFDYICKMGQALDDEKRDFAARSVSILLGHFPLTDLEDAILSKWAERTSFRSNQSAALALVHMVQSEQYQKDILNLINRWSCETHIGFANTVLLTHSKIANMHPDDALYVIKNILLNEKTITQSSREALLLSDDEGSRTKLSWRTIAFNISQLIKELYLNHPLNVIETLHKWFQESTNFSLTVFPAFIFLSKATIKDIAHDNTKRAKTITYLYDLWEGKKSPEHHQVQLATTKTIHRWAKIVLAMEVTDPDRMICQQFFHELYQKCASAKQNRLDFHLRKWQNQLQQSGKSSASSPPALNFLSLIPNSKQA